VFLYICLGVTGLGYAAYFTAIERSSAATASLVFYLKPAVAPVMAMAFLGETVAPGSWAGIALVCAGSAVGIGGPALSRVCRSRRDIRHREL
jgi:drug/metabolite transporter (DMT)-like permease